MAENPLLGCVYGGQGSGKTLGALRAFPAGVFIAAPGALTTQQWLGIKVKAAPAKGIIEATKTIQALAKKPDIKSIVFDDFNLQIDYEIRRIRNSNVTGWAQWNKLSDYILDFRDACLDCSSVIFLTMHERPPAVKEKNGTMVTVPGQPLVPGYDLTNKFPSYFSYLAHVEYDKSNPGWPFMLNTMANEEWLAKDRTSLGIPGRVPMNFGVALAKAGFHSPKPEGMEWMTAEVENVADKAFPSLGDSEALKEVLRSEAQRLSKKVKDNRHVRWTIADGLDTAQLKKAEASMVDSFIDSVTAPVEADDDF
jgi:hypothetical protein